MRKLLHILLYIKYKTGGLVIKIVDIFMPNKPIEVATYDTYPQNNDEGYYGCWGVYPFTQNNYVYASDMQNGLYIFNFEEIFAGFVSGYLYTIQNTPLTISL